MMKRAIQIIFGLLYLAALLFSLIVLVKPGAAIFYKKSQIKNQDLSFKLDTYKYQFTLDNSLYDPETILLFEDQHILKPASVEYARVSGKAQVTIQFVPTPLTDPAIKEHIYTIYIRPYIFSSNLGGIAFLILVLGLIIYVQSKLHDAKIRKVLMKSGIGAWIYKGNRLEGSREKVEIPDRMSVFKQNVIKVVLVAFLYVFMEWIFFVTKPSFMNLLNLGEKVKILFIAGLVVSIFSLVILSIIFLLDFAITPFALSFRKYAFQIPFALIASSLCLILMDNFTYTIFRFGIVDSKTFVREIYALIFISIFFIILRELSIPKKYESGKGPVRINVIAVIFLFSSSLILTLFTFKPLNSATFQTELNLSPNIKPNIILLSTDGLNAKNMSIYGYSRNTTPFISELAKTSLFSANNFTNADSSTGSETSLLTGRLPFTTHVLFPPDILRGVDMYLHLPGLLKRNGYRTISLGETYFLDANAINFQNAFDAVNCMNNPSSHLLGYGYDDEIYFINTITGRIWDRINHIFFIKNMQNPYTAVTQANTDILTDSQRMKCLRTYLDEAIQNKQPLFAHIHLMSTHGSKFAPSVQVFSKDENQNQPWMTDFYDDAILSFDILIDQLVNYLKTKGQFDNTILVLYTDHTQEWTTIEKLPLIIHFPNDRYEGTITENTQNMDIAPTILEYLGIQKPTWMEGSSLLERPEYNRLILAGIKSNNETISGILTRQELKPPFYQFSKLSVIQCQNWYILNLENLTVNQGEVENYTNPCPADVLDTQDVIRKKVGVKLTKLGYDLPTNW